jgi:hypothetical protein
MQEDLDEIQIVSVSSNPQENGIFKFENCKFRNKEVIVKNTSCCSAQKVSGYYCPKINKFPVNFSTDCEKCTLFEQL